MTTHQIAAEAAELINGRVRRFTDTEKAAAINIIEAAIEKALAQCDKDWRAVVDSELHSRAAHASKPLKSAKPGQTESET